MFELNKIYNMDCLKGLKQIEDNTIDCCVTSPPYFGLRNYGVEGQIGLEESPKQYIDRLCLVFKEVFRVLKNEGTLWLNIGDSYNGSGGNHKETHKNDSGFQGNIGVKYGGKGAKVDGLKPKDLIGIPWMLAFALREQGWFLRQDIIWHKPNPMPESVTDRCTKSHEYIFLLSKSEKYYFNNEAIQEPCADQNRTNYQSGSRSHGINNDRNDNDMAERSKVWKPKMKNIQDKGLKPNTMHIRRAMGMKDDTYMVRNKRDVWTVNVKPDLSAHFATYPKELITPCILAGCPKDGIVLDPFGGSGTTGAVAREFGRNFILFELNPDYVKIAERKTIVSQDMFTI